MKKNKICLIIIIFALINIFLGGIVLAENEVIPSAEQEIKKITLSKSEIKINEENISEDINSDIYLKKEENENQIINIVKPGKYEFTGKTQNLQIAVNVEELKKVEIILNNVQITNQNIPAIIIYKGFDFFVENDSGVILNILEGTENKLSGAFIQNEEEKYDGVISSNTSLMITGGGKLEIAAEKEGIETKKNLLINNGNIKIQSKENSIDACLENESNIIINKGNLILNVEKTAEEGNGIYSANKIIINGGEIYSYSSKESVGINAKNILEINGGTIISTGNMMEKYDRTNSKQLGIYIGFKTEKINGTLITLTKQDKTPLFAYSTERTVKGISYSSENLKEDVYKVFIGGTIIGNLKNNLYTDITTYSPGEEQKYVKILKNDDEKEVVTDIVEFKFGRQSEKIENLEKVVIKTDVVEEVSNGDFSAIISLGIALLILVVIIVISKKAEENKKTS